MEILKTLTKWLPRIAIVIIIIIGAFECFYGLDKEPIEKWDEGVYYDVVKSTLDSKDFLNFKIYDYENQFESLTFNDNNFFS